MIFDMTALFSDRQAVTTAAPSTNVIDRGAFMAPQHAIGYRADLGKGNRIPLAVRVTETFAGPSLAQVRIRYQVSDAEDFGSGVIDLADLRVPVADMVAGADFPVPLLNDVPVGANRRYHRLHYAGFQSDGTTAVTMTAGRITAGFVMALDESY